MAQPAIHLMIQRPGTVLITIVHDRGVRSHEMTFLSDKDLRHKATRLAYRLNAVIMDFCPRCTAWNDPDGRTKCRPCGYPI